MPQGMSAEPKTVPRTRPAKGKPAPRRGPTEAAAVDISPLSGHIGFLLRLAQQRVFEEFHRRFGAQGLTPGRYAVLAVLDANPDVRQVAIANALQIKPPNMAVLVTAMEADGLVERRMDTRNRRANMLRLTDKGAGLYAAVAGDIRAMEGEFAAQFFPDGVGPVMAALSRILEPRILEP